MQAVRVHESGVLVDETVPDPVAVPGEVLVELRHTAPIRRSALVCETVLLPGGVQS